MYKFWFFSIWLGDYMLRTLNEIRRLSAFYLLVVFLFILSCILQVSCHSAQTSLILKDHWKTTYHPFLQIHTSRSLTGVLTSERKL